MKFCAKLKPLNVMVENTKFRRSVVGCKLGFESRLKLELGLGLELRLSLE